MNETPHNAQDRAMHIMGRVGEVLSEYFTNDHPPPPGKYEKAIAVQYKDLPIVLTVRLIVEDNGVRSLIIFSHEQGEPHTTFPMFAGHWHPSGGQFDVTVWRSGPWEALFLTGDVAGTA
jgi:hypothetical protein